MQTFRARFRLLREVKVSELIDAIGVYVLWDADAKDYPSYIGWGTILRSLAKYAERHDQGSAHPWNCYIAIMKGCTAQATRTESDTVGGMLMGVANDIFPLFHANVRPDMTAFHCQKTQRVAISGWDPFAAPNRPVSRRHEIRVRRVENGYSIGHTWRPRPTRVRTRSN